MAELVVTAEVRAPAQAAWALLTDWEQSRPVDAAHVRGRSAGPDAASGFTGVGPVGSPTTMTIGGSRRSAAARHTGRSSAAGAFGCERCARTAAASLDECRPPLGNVSRSAARAPTAPRLGVASCSPARRRGRAGRWPGERARRGRPAALPLGCRAPDYLAYHDDEWGRPMRGTTAGLYERMTLESFQSGLSWLTILRKRPAFRAAFAGFDPAARRRLRRPRRRRLMADAGIVRNRAKITAAIANARAVLALDEVAWPSCSGPSPRPGPPGAGHCRRRSGNDAGVGRDVEGARSAPASCSSARPPLRADAGDRDGQRPPGRLRRAGRSRCS